MPKLILHNSSRNETTDDATEIEAANSVVTTSKSVTSRHIRAASQQINCARTLIRLTEDEPMIQVGASSFCYGSMMLTDKEWAYYDSLKNMSPLELIDRVMQSRIDYDSKRPWKSLDCPDRSQFEHDFKLDAQV